MAKVVRRATFVRGASTANFAMLNGSGAFGRREQTDWQQEFEKRRKKKPLSPKKRTRKLFEDLVSKLKFVDSAGVRRKASAMASGRGFKVSERDDGKIRYQDERCKHYILLEIRTETAVVCLRNPKNNTVARVEVKLKSSGTNSRQNTRKSNKRQQNNNWAKGKNGLFGAVKSLEEVNPKAAREWNVKLNNNVAAHKIASNLSLERWWTCSDCGGTYLMSIKDRVANEKCPYCSHKEVLTGFNDLATRAPMLAEELVSDYPEDVLFASDRPKVWECAECGCTWRDTPIDRVKRLVKRKAIDDCPSCGSDTYEALKRGEELPELDISIVTLAPELEPLWCYRKNSSIEPEEVEFMTDEEYCWECVEGHLWYEAPREVVLNNCLCPICTGEDGWITDEDE